MKNRISTIAIYALFFGSINILFEGLQVQAWIMLAVIVALLIAKYGAKVNIDAFLRAIVPYVTYIALSLINKGWAGLFLIFFGLPVLLGWTLAWKVLGRGGKKSSELALTAHIQTVVTFNILAFTTPGLSDTDDSSAFTFLMVSYDSPWTYISTAFMALSGVVIVVNSLRHLIILAKSKSKESIK